MLGDVGEGTLTCARSPQYGRNRAMFLIRCKWCAAFAWIVLISGALAILFSSRVCIAGDDRKAVSRPPVFSGTIHDALGRPIAGARVRLQAAGRVVARTHTDSTGVFQFKTVAPEATPSA